MPDGSLSRTERKETMSTIATLQTELPLRTGWVLCLGRIVSVPIFPSNWRTLRTGWEPLRQSAPFLPPSNAGPLRRKVEIINEDRWYVHSKGEGLTIHVDH